MRSIMDEQIDILVVDDDKRSANFITELLRDEGYNVAESYRGRHALEHIWRQQPRLLITDISMPEMNGFELAGHVRQRFADIPVIFTSAQPENLRQLPFGDGLDKPLDIDALLELVEQNLHTLNSR